MFLSVCLSSVWFSVVSLNVGFLGFFPSVGLLGGWSVCWFFWDGQSLLLLYQRDVLLALFIDSFRGSQWTNHILHIISELCISQVPQNH